MRHFDGEFSNLPIRAHLDIGPVPSRPTSDDFQDAAVRAGLADPFTIEGAAAHWYMEAVRERRLRPGAALDDTTLREIAKRVGERLHKAQRNALDY